MNDYHQKPIDSMTPGELRAYRRELARAALTGWVRNPEIILYDPGLPKLCLHTADAMIEHERREEGGAE